MQRFGAKALALLAFVGPCAAEAEQSNPLGKVLELMDGLSSKITAEGETEDKAYKEYFEYCDDVATSKGFEIKTATSQKGKLEAKIGELTAAIEVAGSKIAELAASVSASDGDLKAATAVHEKETADFVSSEKELVEVVDTLGRAVSVLGRDSASLAQVSSTDFAGVVQSLGAISDAAAFSANDKQRLVALVQAHQGEEDEELGAPAAAAYKGHSGGILDLLGDMQEKAEAQLSDLRKSQANAKHNYQMLKQSLTDQLSADNKDMANQKSNKASAEEGTASAEGELATTVKDLATAKEALEMSQATCMQVAADHEATVKSRAEELKVVAEATEILRSSTGGGVGQTYSLLQATASARADLARSEVAALVKRLARQQHSSALAQLASRIATAVRYGAGTRDGPFDKVKGMINDMISKLEAEAGAEATEKAYCDEEMAKTSAKQEELNGGISKLTTKIDQATAKSAELKADVKELQSELATMLQEQAEADKMRQETHTSFGVAKAELEQAISGVRNALRVLRDYYAAKEEDAAALLQDGDDQPAKPKVHEKSSGAAGSIIAILEVAESDFADNLAKEETQEADAQEAYEKMTQENKVTKAEKDQDVAYKTKEFTSLDQQLAELSSDRETADAELSAVNEYDVKLKERCVAKPETYEARAARRAAEIAGLKEALEVLANEASLLQRSGGKRHGRRSNMRGSTLRA